MIPLVERHLSAIAALCRRYGVLRLSLFAFAADARLDEATGDLRFVADFADPLVPGYADRYFGFVEDLAAVLGRPVDVITERSIETPWLREAVEASRQPVYDARSAPTAA